MLRRVHLGFRFPAWHKNSNQRPFRRYLALPLVIALLVPVTGVQQSAAASIQVLVLGSTVLGGTNSLEAQEITAQGYTPVVVSDATWEAMTTSQFSAYRAIVIGDPDCGSYNDLSHLTAALANPATWGAAVTGNTLIIGTDPVFHSMIGTTGAGQLIKSGIDFALAQPGKTGAYIDLSCAYGEMPANTPAHLLDGIAGGGFTVDGGPSTVCYNQAHIVAVSPALTGLTDADLSNWSCSVHEAFDSWPGSFVPLAIAKDFTYNFTASDGTQGPPYILAAGNIASFPLSLSPLTDSGPAGTSHTVTATLLDATTRAPVSGAKIGFGVTSGPNTGVMGSCVPSSCLTQSNGTVSWTYISNGTTGADTIRAFYDENGNGTADPGEPRTTAGMQWTLGCTPGNQLANPGFEQPVYPDAPDTGNWSALYDSSSSAADSAQRVHSGNFSMRVMAKKGGYASVSQSINGFQPSQGWSFSAFVSPSGGYSQSIIIASADTLGDQDHVTVFLPAQGIATLSANGGTASGSAPLSDNMWHFVALTGSAHSVAMTIDGQSTVTVNYTPPKLGPVSTTTVTLGTLQSSMGPYTPTLVSTEFYYDDVSLSGCGSVSPTAVPIGITDTSWSATASFTTDSGLVVSDMTAKDRFGSGSSRDLGANISMPYLNISTTSHPASRTLHLYLDGDELDPSGHVFAHSILISGPTVTRIKQRGNSARITPGAMELSATYRITFSPVVPGTAGSELDVTEKYQFVDTIDEGATNDDGSPIYIPCEPSQSVPIFHGAPLICDRFRPILEYSFSPGVGDGLINIEASQRLHFRPDRQEIQASTLIHDCDISESSDINGDTCIPQFAPTPGVAVYSGSPAGTQNGDPLAVETTMPAIEYANTGSGAVGSGNMAGFFDNVHLTTHSSVALPVPIPPGCEECIHIHWRWGADIGSADLGSGNPLVGDSGTVPSADTSSAQETFVSLVSNGGADDNAFLQGSGSVNNGAPPALSDPVVWYLSSSPQATNAFFAWGGFVCPSCT